MKELHGEIYRKYYIRELLDGDWTVERNAAVLFNARSLTDARQRIDDYERQQGRTHGSNAER